MTKSGGFQVGHRARRWGVLLGSVLAAVALLATVAPASALVAPIPGSPDSTLPSDVSPLSAEIAYNPDRDEYMVVHRGFNSVEAVRVAPDGTPIGSSIFIGSASDFGFPDIAYNSNSQRYLITWVQDGGAGSSLQSIVGTVLDGVGNVVGSSVLHGSLGDQPACTARYSRVVSDDTSSGFAVLYTHYYGSESPGFNCAGLAPTAHKHVLRLVGSDLALGASTELAGIGAGDPAGMLARHPVTGDYLVGQPTFINPTVVQATTLDSALNVLGTGPLAGDGATASPQAVGDPGSTNWIGVAGGAAETSLLARDASTLRASSQLSITVSTVHDVVAMGDGTFVAAANSGSVAQFGTDGVLIHEYRGIHSGLPSGPRALARGGDMNSVMEVGRNPNRELFARPLLVAPPARCAGELVTVYFGLGQLPTAGDDVILGTDGDDVIQGLAGDDVICALDGNDRVVGGNGNDTILGGAGDDKLFGRQGDDRIEGGLGHDTIHGNKGDDELLGQDGDDRIFGYADDDTISGGAGDDGLHGNFGDDVINGGDGDDRIFGYGDNDELNGGAGNDLLSGNFGDDTLNGGPGNDTMFGAGGADTVNGGQGNDEVSGNSGNDTLNGNAGNDTLDGGINVDVCNGQGGTDTETRCETITGVP